MIIDSSAIIAILCGEPEAKFFIEKIVSDPVRLISAANALEAAMVLTCRKGDAGKKNFDEILNTAKIKIVSVDDKQYKNAYDAWRKYGKGRHPAKLNFGDCFAYALAQDTQQPLLFKGNDFNKTDLKVA